MRVSGGEGGVEVSGGEGEWRGGGVEVRGGEGGGGGVCHYSIEKLRPALTYASFHVTITVITMAANSTSTMPAMIPPTFVPESGEEGLVITFFTPLICVLMLQRSCNPSGFVRLHARVL